MEKILWKQTGITEITNRDDLINALTIASQLEHGLMLMYLYAAYSMKSNTAEFDGSPEEREVLRDKVRNWEGMILRVARQEMEHLGFVCNLLSAIGGPQYFDRPNFPQDKKIWGTDLPIELERFCPSSLRRFLAFEKPANLVDPLFDDPAPQARARGVEPEDPEYHSIGQLYAMIRRAFDTIPEETLFIVPPTAQVDNETLFGDNSLRAIYNMRLFKTWDKVSAKNAVDEIVEQGEGTLSTGKDDGQPITPSDLDPSCHYMQFRQIYIEYVLGCDPDDEAAVNACRGQHETQHEPVFEGARPCVRNPALQLHQDTINAPVYQGNTEIQPENTVAIIDHPYTKQVLGVANASYETLLQLLIRLYAAADDTSAESTGLVGTAFFPLMTMVIRPLSELLSQLPAFEVNPHNLTAGCGFEYYRTVGFLPFKPAAWIYLHERMRDIATAFAEANKGLTDEQKCEFGVTFIEENLRRIADDFKTFMDL